MIELVMGNDLSEDQKRSLKFSVVKFPTSLPDFGFYFEDGKPCERFGFNKPLMYPDKQSFRRVHNFNNR